MLPSGTIIVRAMKEETRRAELDDQNNENVIANVEDKVKRNEQSSVVAIIAPVLASSSACFPDCSRQRSAYAPNVFRQFGMGTGGCEAREAGTHKTTLKRNWNTAINHLKDRVKLLIAQCNFLVYAVAHRDGAKEYIIIDHKTLSWPVMEGKSTTAIPAATTVAPINCM